MKTLLNGCLALTGAVIGLATGAEAKDCEFDPIRLYHNQTSESRLIIKAGKRCGIFFGGTDGVVHETFISQKAKVGVVATDNARVVYVAKTGFVGADEFTYARKGADRFGNPSVMSVRVKVEVVP
jgi:hypothetical protein